MVFLSCSPSDKVLVTNDIKIAQCFGLIGHDFNIIEGTENGTISVGVQGVGVNCEWYLKCGLSYKVICESGLDGENRCDNFTPKITRNVGEGSRHYTPSPPSTAPSF